VASLSLHQKEKVKQGGSMWLGTQVKLIKLN